MTNVTD